MRNFGKTSPSLTTSNIDMLKQQGRVVGREVGPNTDSLFASVQHTSGEWLTFEDLPELARPIVEYIHDTRPDVVIAGDRGGRFGALAVFASYKHRFPNHQFPTLDKKIHFARISSRSAHGSAVKSAVNFTLDQAGLGNWKKDFKNGPRTSPRVLYVDDWAVYGDTAERFIQAARAYGLPKSGLSFATMCGPEKVNSIPHLSGNPARHPRSAVWNDDSSLVGIDYGWTGIESVTPTNLSSRIARQARQTLLGGYMPDGKTYVPGLVEQYYERFNAAISMGELSACACLDPTLIVQPQSGRI